MCERDGDYLCSDPGYDHEGETPYIRPEGVGDSSVDELLSSQAFRDEVSELVKQQLKIVSSSEDAAQLTGSGEYRLKS